LKQEVLGFLNVDKPSGPTSHDVIQQLRQITGIQKMGHTGTLDPLASGVLPICVGKATRLSEYLTGSDKRYLATIQLGQRSSTYDAEGQLSPVSDISNIQERELLSTLAQLTGEIQQTVPVYSAVKRDGKKLYQLARAGIQVSPPMRKVFIQELKLKRWCKPQLEVEVHCSSGTYIRSLAHDVGERLGVGAHLSALKRIASGPFQLCHARSTAELAASGNWKRHLLDPVWPFQSWSKISFHLEEATALCQGKTTPIHETETAEKLALALYRDRLIAVVQAVAGAWQPIKVFRAAHQLEHG